ncbi:MAG: Crp/Fnr family transcriptional regulator [Caenibius sp.]
MSYCDTCVVRNRAICSALDPNEIEAMSASGRRRVLQPGQSLLWEGDESAIVANVIRGIMKLTSSTEDGREQIVGLVYPADFVGRPYGSTSLYSVTALDETEVCIYGRGDFEQFAQSHPAMEHKLLERTLSELDRTRRWMLLLGRKSANERIASFLLEMADRLSPHGAGLSGGCAPVDDHIAFDLPLSRQQIGDVLGLTIETVSRQFNRLKSDGIIALPSRRAVIVNDREALMDLAG